MPYGVFLGGGSEFASAERNGGKERQEHRVEQAGNRECAKDILRLERDAISESIEHLQFSHWGEDRIGPGGNGVGERFEVFGEHRGS